MAGDNESDRRVVNLVKQRQHHAAQIAEHHLGTLFLQDIDDDLTSGFTDDIICCGVIFAHFNFLFIIMDSIRIRRASGQIMEFVKAGKYRDSRIAKHGIDTLLVED
jgi:hypothetical protein